MLVRCTDGHKTSLWLAQHARVGGIDRHRVRLCSEDPLVEGQRGPVVEQQEEVPGVVCECDRYGMCQSKINKHGAAFVEQQEAVSGVVCELDRSSMCQSKINKQGVLDQQTKTQDKQTRT